MIKEYLFPWGTPAAEVRSRHLLAALKADRGGLCVLGLEVSESSDSPFFLHVRVESLEMDHADKALHGLLAIFEKGVYRGQVYLYEKPTLWDRLLETGELDD